MTSLQAGELLQKFGLNEITERRKKSLLLQFFAQFKDIMVLILIGAAIIAYIAGENIDSIIILFIVFLNASIGFIQEFKAERAIEALKKLLSPKARIVRDNKEIIIEAKFLVPGDILILSEGDKVAADCELLQENEIFADESVLTGESVPVKKNTSVQKALFMGTQITHGSGEACVSATGMRTKFGRIATLTSETKKDKSPLQKEMLGIGLFVGKITIGISAALLAVGIFAQDREILDSLLFAVSVAVAAVPEGLPTTITLALALGVQRLARENAIVKQLSSVETLGSTTVICSDKTGTLTKNEMTVQEAFIDGFDITVKGVGYEPTGIISIDHFDFEKNNVAELALKNAATFNALKNAALCAILCNNARLAETDGEWKILGDPTEGALVVFAEKAGFSAEQMRQKYVKLQEIPFDSNRKRMSVIVKEINGAEHFALIKGAPDSILALCNMPPERKKEILERTEAMAGRALRTIALARKRITIASAREHYTKEEIECDLEFLGLVGMMDPPREEVREAVKLTRKAGIRIFIVTGDHGMTALAVTRELGIAERTDTAIITGEMLDKMSDEKLLNLLQPGASTIFARVNPEHKLRIVDALKRNGETVAVTGDGVNDAPALKRADIGIAMGITGTDVSKEAANMVLADDSFRTIVTAVIEGRTIYENMKKFIYYIFASNIGELIAVFSTIIIGLPAPLTAIFMLIINTLTDVFPSLALAVEPVERAILERPPRKSSAKIMEKQFILRYVSSGLCIGAITFAIFMWPLLANGWRFGQNLDLDTAIYIKASTLAFVTVTLLQMVHAFNSRSTTVSVFRMNFFGNLPLVAATFASTVATIALVSLPFFQKYLKTTGLNGMEWLIVALSSFGILLFVEIRKAFARRAGAGLQHA